MTPHDQRSVTFIVISYGSYTCVTPDEQSSVHVMIGYVNHHVIRWQVEISSGNNVWQTRKARNLQIVPLQTSNSLVKIFINYAISFTTINICQHC